MKTIKYIFLIAVMSVVAFSCKDEALDPLRINDVKKGTILALRGKQLDNIYVKGKPGAELFPKIATGAEKFEFDAEYLSDDKSSLESMDVYVITRPVRTKVLLANIPFSQFKDDGTYRNPWVSVSFTVGEVLAKVLPAAPTFPLSAADINVLLTTYTNGIRLEIDLNKTDGTQVMATDLVSAGLFQSDQFYPAQLLSYAMTDYCAYTTAGWSGDYDATELSELFGAYGPYTITAVQDGTDPNKFSTDNWYDSGLPLYWILSPSTDPGTQIVTIPVQNHPTVPTRTIGGFGTSTYDQCKYSLAMNIEYKNGDGSVRDKMVWKLVHQ